MTESQALASIAPTVSRHDGRLWTTSLEIARRFGKRHDNVLRAVIALNADLKTEASNPALTEPKNGLSDPALAEFRRSNFGQSSYIDSTGRSLPMYEVSRDGFSLLAMGFTGAEALRWKVAFIAAFNALEQAALHDPLRQAEAFWFAARPHWLPIRTLALEGLRNWAISECVGRSPGSVGRCLRRMIRVGLLDPRRLTRARYSRRTAERRLASQQLCLDWGRVS